jgi:hypothetical protein
LICTLVAGGTKVGPMLRPALVLALVAVSILGRRPAHAGEPPVVEYSNDRLTLHAREAPVTAVLDEVKRQSGADVRGEPAAASVTLDLEAVPLREALERMLGPRSFTLTYGDNGHLKAIELKGGPQAASVAGEAPGRSSPAPTRKETWDGVGRVFNGRGEIPMSPRLKEMTAPFMAGEMNGYVILFRVAGGSQDRAMRRQAWRDGIKALEADVDMRNSLIAAVGMMDDTELTTFARTLAAMTPDSAEDLTKLVIRTSTTPELESRARNILHQLRLERAQTAGR